MDRCRLTGNRLIEMQAILVALIEEFEFSLPPTGKDEDIEILRTPVGIMSPTIKGRPNDGVQMPLIVKKVTS